MRLQTDDKKDCKRLWCVCTGNALRKLLMCCAEW